MAGRQRDVRTLRVTAYAKVNLSLEVLGRRPDGFHEVRSVMQSISLADELLIDEADELAVECEIRELADENNLIVAAAKALAKRSEREQGARIRLNKGIPVASGLGGASSDAAAALVGLSRLWGMDLPTSELIGLAAGLGSDVPFFLSGGTALVSGRGEIVDPLPDAQPVWLTLLVPGHTLASKTALLYRHLTSALWTQGARTARMAAVISQGLPLTPDLAGNAFEQVAAEVFPTISAYEEALLDAGASSAHLSGAGPALFSIFGSEAEARAVARGVETRGFKPLVARTLSAADACPVARE